MTDEPNKQEPATPEPASPARVTTVRPPRRPEPRSLVMWVAIAATIAVAAGVLYTALQRSPAPPAQSSPSATPR